MIIRPGEFYEHYTKLARNGDQPKKTLRDSARLCGSKKVRGWEVFWMREEGANIKFLNQIPG